MSDNNNGTVASSSCIDNNITNDNTVKMLLGLTAGLYLTFILIFTCVMRQAIRKLRIIEEQYRIDNNIDILASLRPTANSPRSSEVEIDQLINSLSHFKPTARKNSVVFVGVKQLTPQEQEKQLQLQQKEDKEEAKRREQQQKEHLLAIGSPLPRFEAVSSVSSDEDNDDGDDGDHEKIQFNNNNNTSYVL